MTESIREQRGRTVREDILVTHGENGSVTIGTAALGGPSITLASFEWDALTKHVAAAERRRADVAEKRLAELENAVSWQTSCTSCAATLDASYQATVRAESAEEKLAQIRDLAGELVTSPGVRRLVLGILDGAS
jgi:hypothetical protein